MNFNKAIVAGRLTDSPELRTTPTGQPVTSIRIATNRTWTDKAGQKQEKTEFHAVVIWGKQAEIASAYLQKGSTVLIEGRLENREWEKKDGSKGYATEIICENLQLGPKPLESGATKTAGVGGIGEPPEKPIAHKPAKEEAYDGNELKPLFGDPKGEIDVSNIPF